MSYHHAHDYGAGIRGLKTETTARTTGRTSGVTESTLAVRTRSVAGIFTDLFSGPGGSIIRVCVCLYVRQ